MVRNTYLVEGEARSRRRPPGLKSFLIALNIQVDWLLDSIRSIEYSWDPIIWHDGHSEIERLTLLLEDRRYYRHSGFDPWCIPRVVRQALTFKRIGGVSTIEQQLVRTILSRRERTIRRKSREILLAWILTHRKSKREILRAYLATAYYGYKLRGCDETARLLFGENAGDLAIEPAAMLASMLVYPLPKAIKQNAGCQAALPVQDLSAFLDTCGAITPKWAKKIRRRVNYGVALRRHAK